MGEDTKELVIVRDFDDAEYASIFGGVTKYYVRFAYGDYNTYGEDFWMDYSKLGGKFVLAGDVWEAIEHTEVPSDTVCLIVRDTSIIAITSRYLKEVDYSASVSVFSTMALSLVVMIIPETHVRLSFPIHPLLRDSLVALVSMDV